MKDWVDIVARLQSHGLMFEPGLTDTEVTSAESAFGFRFPPDLRALLRTALPRGKGFPDWRTGNETELRDWLDLPRRGIVFDIEYNTVWLEEWGPKPDTIGEARRIAEGLVASAPQLIPIYMHRFIADHPCLPGNPVFSVHQTDIIVYGTDLEEYLIRDFLTDEDDAAEWSFSTEPRPIPFWNVDRFQAGRWVPPGICAFDNGHGPLPR